MEVAPSLHVIGVAPFRNCTVPVGLVPPSGANGKLFGSTSAVKVTGSPSSEGEPLEVTVVVVPYKSICVAVLSVAPTTFGSSVSTLAKLLPETVPWFSTRGGLSSVRFAGLFTVTWKLIVTLPPAGNVPILAVTVSPDIGAGAAGALRVASFVSVAYCALSPDSSSRVEFRVASFEVGGWCVLISDFWALTSEL